MGHPFRTSAGDDDPFERLRADALVTRRDYLRILVTISGGLALGAVAIVAGVFPRRTGSSGILRIASAIDPGGSVSFAYPGPDDRAIAMRLSDGSLVAYSSICTHLSCAVLWRSDRNELACPCHDGRFDAVSGRVLGGPPPRPLPRIELEERPDGIYAVRATV